jgi:hypothetical protein
VVDWPVCVASTHAHSPAQDRTRVRWQMARMRRLAIPAAGAPKQVISRTQWSDSTHAPLALAHTPRTRHARPHTPSLPPPPRAKAAAAAAPSRGSKATHRRRPPGEAGGLRPPSWNPRGGKPEYFHAGRPASSCAAGRSADEARCSWKGLVMKRCCTSSRLRRSARTADVSIPVSPSPHLRRDAAGSDCGGACAGPGRRGRRGSAPVRKWVATVSGGGPRAVLGAARVGSPGQLQFLQDLWSRRGPVRDRAVPRVGVVLVVHASRGRRATVEAVGVGAVGRCPVEVADRSAHRGALRARLAKRLRLQGPRHVLRACTSGVRADGLRHGQVPLRLGEPPLELVAAEDRAPRERRYSAHYLLCRERPPQLPGARSLGAGPAGNVVNTK